MIETQKFLSKNGLCCGLIGLFALLLWGQTARFDFVWDDGVYITQNMSIRSLANFPKFFCRMEAQSAENPSISYRPLRNTFYALLYALDGKRDAAAVDFSSGQCPLARRGGDAAVFGRAAVVPAADRRGLDRGADGLAVDRARLCRASGHLGGGLLGKMHG